MTLLLISLGILAWSGLFDRIVIGKTFLHTVDRRAEKYYNASLGRALVTYGVVRGINAVISVIQGSDISLSPAGMGITLAAGEILDPLNDLIERFSWIILVAVTSLGIQKILLPITAWIGFTLLLGAASWALALSLWLPRLKNVEILPLGLRLLLLALILRYALPLTAWATSSIDSLFLQPEYTQASATLETAAAGLEDEKATIHPGQDNSLLQRFKNLLQSAEKTVALEKRIESVKSTVGGYIDRVVDLIVIFLLQTIIIPVAVLFLLLKGLGWILRLDLVNYLHPPAGGLHGRRKIVSRGS